MKWFSILLITVIQQCTAGSWTIEQTKCPPVSFPNGKVRTRGRGKIIRFSCSDDFTLIGNRYSTCVRGNWDTPTPVCVSSQCPILPTPEHALIASKYNGAVLMYFCEPGYKLVGTSEIYCNGKQWNGTAPSCRDTTSTAPLKCDFEKTDLCWWEQDPKHDFDWQRHNFGTPSSHIGTGPTHDHTLGVGNDGYYLYIEASGRLENDTARIISPLYSSNLTANGCFSLWYHMYGSTIGWLRVYIKPEMYGENPRLMFEKHGNQGNQWHQGLFDLPKTNVSFQIIIEGVRGFSYVSDVAIDDVAILQGDDCQTAKAQNSATTIQSITQADDQIEIVNAMQSCRGRCNDTPTINAWTTIIPMTSPDACHCTIDCADNSTCCPDFSEYCILAFTDNSMLQTSTMMSAEALPSEPKDEIDPNASQPPERSTTEKPTSTTSQRSVTKSVPITTTTTKKKQRPKTITTTTKTTKVPIHVETPFVIGTTTTIYYQIPTESNVLVEKVQHYHHDTLNPAKIIVIVVVPIAAMIILGIALFFIFQRKKSYKRNSGKVNGSTLPEDSDVRFLTSDEVLDFNLARPSEYNEL